MESNAAHLNHRMPLHGIGVLVTRPAGRAAELCACIEKYGGRAISFPVINITPPQNASALLAALRRLDAVDLMLFVSAHAVDGVVAALKQHQLSIPIGTRVAAIGVKTAAQCARASITVDYVPGERMNSEGLLEELHDLKVAGKNILIFRAQSGRELIKQALELRGAQVSYVESYRRTLADYPPTNSKLAPILADWQQNQIHAVIIGSAAVLDALLELIGAHNRSLPENTPIFAYSQRVADYCQAVGLCRDIRIAKQPTDESIVASLIEWAGESIMDNDDFQCAVNHDAMG